MASKIKDTLAQLRGIEASLNAETARAMGDWRLSDAAKKERADAHRAALRESVADAAYTIFGKPGPNGLEGGHYWQERERLEAKRREARDRADTLDQTRLANTYARIGSMVQQAETPQELAAWYNQSADSYERRALQDMGAERIAARWPNHETVGGLIGTLKRDRARALATPELQAVEDQLRALDLDTVDAHDELSRYNASLGDNDPFDWGGTTRVLRAVRVTVRLGDVSDPHAPSIVSIEKADAGGVYWKNGAPED